MKRIAAALCLSSLTLAGCGFTPMYANLDTTEVGSIRISEIEGYAGHAMRRELMMQLRPGLPGVESGVLVVETDESIQNFDFQINGSTARTRVTVAAKYTLTTPTNVWRGRVEGTSNIAPSTQPYSDITARRDASAKAALEAAIKMADQLRFNTGKSSSPSSS